MQKKNVRENDGKPQNLNCHPNYSCTFIISSYRFLGFNGLEQGVDLKGGSLAELQLLGSVTPSELEDTLDAKLNTNNIKVTSNGNNKVTVELENNINSSTFTSAINGKAKVISYNEILS